MQAIQSHVRSRAYRFARRVVRPIVVGFAWFQLWANLLGVSLALSPWATVPWVAAVAALFWAWTRVPGPLGRLRQAARFRLRRPRAPGRWMAWTVATTTCYALAVLIAIPVPHPVPSTRSTIIGQLLSRPGAGLQVLLLVVTLGPLLEELFFRGYIQRPLERAVGAPVAIAVSTTLFALAHFLRPLPLPQLALGLLTGYAAYATRSIWPGFVVHLSYNAVTILGAAAGRWGGIPIPRLTSLGAAGGWAVVALTAAPVLWVLHQIGRARRGAKRGHPRTALAPSTTGRAAG
ncbi:MAG: CPBP family intramembrane metalloprotease [Gemmatimonadetes bacterium]|nr:CPBP family intramembrane metalloprotease [Gemmatimonadota bacterium]